MGENVVARQMGDQYQALFFWSEVGRALKPNSNVEKITWESNKTEGYDDVVTHYVAPGRRCNEQLITTDHYQVKHHSSQAKQFTWQSLIDPDFVGTTKATILSRLYDIYKKDADVVNNSRFIIINTWGLDSKDPLGVLIGIGGALKLNVLFDGKGPNTKFGKIRKAWRDHLGITTDEELRKILTPLRIQHSYPDIDTLLEWLSDRLQLAGIQPLSPEKRGLNGMVEVIQRLHGGGRKEFTPAELQQICKEEGLMLKEVIEEDMHVIGVRSFYKGAQELHLEVHEMLCLLDKFSGRFLEEDATWAEVFEEIEKTASKAIEAKKPLKLHLDTHLSLAFGLGYCLDSKSGVHATVVQKTANKKLLWSVDLDSLPDTTGNWTFQTHDADGGENELAVCINVTHNILPDVLQHEKAQSLKAAKVLSAVINPGTSAAAFKNGNHIYAAVQELVARIRQEKQAMKPGAVIRLYISGPVAFAFFFGQQALSLVKLTLFEYDFEQQREGGYHPSISLPIVK